jgi:hypothetical protein
MKVLIGVGFVLVATSLLCWFSTSDYWIFDPLTGGLIFLGAILFIGYFAFLSIENVEAPSNRM